MAQHRRQPRRKSPLRICASQHSQTRNGPKRKRPWSQLGRSRRDAVDGGVGMRNKLPCLFIRFFSSSSLIHFANPSSSSLPIFSSTFGKLPPESMSITIERPVSTLVDAANHTNLLFVPKPHSQKLQICFVFNLNFYVLS